MIKVLYEDIPYGIDTDVSANQTQSISNLTELDFGTTVSKVATLESNAWVLDGSFILPSNSLQRYYWNKYTSNNNGEYVDYPTLTIELDAVASATGITFEFEDYYTFEITWKLNGTTQRVLECTNTELSYFVSAYVDGFNYIQIKFKKSKYANRLLKIDNVVIGRLLTLTGEDIVSASAVSEVNSISTELAIDTFDIEFKDFYNRTFDFQSRQKMTVKMNDNLIGVYYVNEATRNSKRDYAISCVDLVGLLDTANYMGGIYTNITVQQLIADIINDNSVTIDATSDILSTQLSGYLPICTKREALNQVAFATGCAITTYGVDGLKFLNMSTQIESTIATTRVFTGASVDTTQRISYVSLSSHSYALGDTKQIFKDTVTGTQTITHSSPYANYTISGGTIVASGANYITVTGTGAEVTINGTEYVDNVVVITKTNPKTNQVHKNNIIEITDATLVNATNVNKVLDLVYDYYLNLDTLKETIIANDNFAGQRVISQNPFGEFISGYITKMNLRFTRNVYADIEIVGSVMGLETVAPIVNTFYIGESLWI